MVLSIGREVENFHVCKRTELNEGINLMLRISILRGLNARSSQNTVPVSVTVVAAQDLPIIMETISEVKNFHIIMDVRLNLFSDVKKLLSRNFLQIRNTPKKKTKDKCRL